MANRKKKQNSVTSKKQLKGSPGVNQRRRDDTPVHLTDRFNELFTSINQANKALKRSIESAATKTSAMKSKTKKAGTASPCDITPPTLPEERYNKEQSPELFSVYIEQLRKNIEQLKAFTDSLTQEKDKSHLLNRCSDIITRLHSLAAYMEYDELTVFYGHWIAEIEETEEKYASGSPVSYDFMRRNLTTINTIFPEITIDNTNRLSADTNQGPQQKNHRISLENRFDILLQQVDAPSSAQTKQENPGNSSLSDVFRDINDLPDKHDFRLYDQSAEEDPQPEAVTPHDNREFMSESELQRQELFEKLSNDLLSLANNLNESIQDDDPDQILAILQEELEQGNYDQDVFSLYIQEVKAELICLKQLIKNILQDKHNQQRYNLCITSIKKLHSSSGKMDFIQQETFHEQWLRHIRDSIDAVNDDEEVELDYMRNNLEIIGKTFSNYFEFSPEIQLEQEESPDCGDCVLPHDANPLPPSSEDPQLFTRLTNALDEQFNQRSSANNEPLSSSVDDDELFVKLSKSLRNNFFGRKTTPMKLTTEVINKILEEASSKDNEVIHQENDNELDYSIIDLKTPLPNTDETNTPNTILQQTSHNASLLRNCLNWLTDADSVLEHNADEIQHSVLNVQMMPLSKLYRVYQKLIKGLINKTGKNIQFIITGDEIELDKIILEELSGPLIQVMRNSIDHGIGANQERNPADKNKSSAATLLFETRQTNNTAIIEISDDGQGIDPLLIKKRASAIQLLPEDKLKERTDPEILRLLLTPGFTPFHKVKQKTDRGVGLDVVYQSIKNINGTIDIESRKGFGTLTRIKIPLAMTINRVMDAKAGERLFSIPRSDFEETLRISQEFVIEKEGMLFLNYHDSLIPLINLAEAFNLQKETKGPSHLCIIIVKAGGQTAGLVVDDCMLQPVKAMVKSLKQYLTPGSCFTGICIKNDQTSLVLDVERLIHSSLRTTA